MSNGQINFEAQLILHRNKFVVRSNVLKETHYTQNVNYCSKLFMKYKYILVKAGHSISVYQCIFYADCERRKSSNKASVRDVYLNDCLRIKVFVECVNKLYLEVCELIFYYKLW